MGGALGNDVKTTTFRDETREYGKGAWIVCFEPEHVGCGATRLRRVQKAHTE